ncbi:MAG: dTDP-4-dehydrorhamnose reductase [Ignavibacteriales bacterium]|nr:dTDP-4-dehydrorhamnose reductase [Ignavibacteriales bacterium]
MKRILICGSNGLLGQRLAIMLSSRTEYEVLNTSHHRSFVFDHQLFDYTQLDLTRKSDVKSLVSSFQPDVIMNAAGATNVDWCENHREEAWNVNVLGVEHLLEAARKVKAKLIHVSTDYVFDGKTGDYAEHDKPNPINYYGKTKLAGENAIRISEINHAIARTIVVYGHGINVRKNFALWVIENLKNNQAIRCVDDQISNPTYVGDVAFGIIKIAELDRSGVYHIGGSERISRYDFALRIAKVFRLETSMIQRIKTWDLNQAALRPMNTTLITLKAETELGLKPVDITQGVTLLKRELQTTRKN